MNNEIRFASGFSGFFFFSSENTINEIKIQY